MHLLVAVVLVLNHFNELLLGVSKDTINTLAVIFYVVVIVQLSVDFVFEKATTDEETALKFWLYIEMLIFFTNLVSNIIFMLYRSCSINRIYSSLT